MVEKIMNILGAVIQRTIVRNGVKKVVKRRVDKFWEKNKRMIMEKIYLL
ncbi:MAG: hypothetical protein ACFFE4_03705 [Candidatus Thorarchaeota archaeon]